MVFVFDLDGTLLDDKERLSEANKKAVLRAAQNHFVILASGRMLKSILKFSLEQFSTEFPTIAYNGSMVYVPGMGIVHHEKIPPETAAKVIEKLREYKVHRQAYVDDNLLSEEDNEEIKAYAKHSGVEYHVVEDLVSIVSKSGSTKILAIAKPDKLDEIKSDLSPSFKNLRIFKSFPTYLDFVPQNVGKAKALETLSKILHFDLKNAVAFGDNDNDADMIKKVGWGVAMENATTAVKEVAKFVAPSNNDSGVAKVVNIILDFGIEHLLRLETR